MELSEIHGAGGVNTFIFFDLNSYKINTQFFCLFKFGFSFLRNINIFISKIDLNQSQILRNTLMTWFMVIILLTFFS